LLSSTGSAKRRSPSLLFFFIGAPGAVVFRLMMQWSGGDWGQLVVFIIVCVGGGFSFIYWEFKLFEWI